MKVVVDCYSTFVGDRLERVEGVDEVVYLPPERIDREVVMDADALIVRTRTRCDADLLEGTRVGLVATATIGVDHFDIPYLESRGIVYTNAAGCNAPAVAQWVFAAIGEVKGEDVAGLTLGVVGCGNVGSIVAEWGRKFGMKVLLNDPPKAALKESRERYVTLEEICRQADIITFHPTLNPTSRHLGNRKFFEQLAKRPMILNASRGPVVDTSALIDAIDRGLISSAAIDTWEGEPQVSQELMARAVIATPHIAGYSIQGKRRAADAVVEAVERYLKGERVNLDAPRRGVAPGKLREVMASYDIKADDAIFRAHPEEMEKLRDGYSLRDEFGV